MKLNLKVFKKGKPIYWLIGAVVIFVIFYLIASKGAGSSSGGVAVVGGTAQTDNSVALANAQASANANNNAAAVAIAQLEYQGKLAETQAGADVAKYVANLDANTTMLGFTTQMEAIKVQAEYGLESSRVAAETNLAGQALNAQVLIRQLDTNAAMFNNSLAANVEQSRITSQTYIATSALGQVSTLKKKDRDETLQIIAGQAMGAPQQFYNPSGSAVIYPKAIAG